MDDKLKEVYTGQKRKRGKKGKEARDFNYQSAAYGGVKYKKEKGAEQKILDMIISGVNDTTDYEGIIAYLKTKNVNIGIPDARFYSVLATNIYNNTKLNLNDLINSKNFVYTISMNESNNYPYKMNVFSNDKLTWITMVYTRCKAKFDKILPLMKLDDLEISIRTIAAEIKENYSKGFYIDFSKDVSFIGYDLLSSTELNAFYEATDDGSLLAAVKDNKYVQNADIKKTDCFVSTYKIDETEYNYKYIGNGICLTYKKDADYKKIIENAKLIEGKTEKDTGLKIRPTDKSLTFCYISQKIGLAEFSPSIIETSNYLYTTFSITSELDLNAFEKYSYDTFSSSTTFKPAEIIPFDNFIYIDNFESFMQFYIVEYSIRYKNNATLKSKDEEKYGDFCKKSEAIFNYYTDNKGFFRIIKNLVNGLIRMYLRFYDSYTNKINIDTTKSLKTLVYKLKIEFETLEKNGSILNFIEWINTNFNSPGFKGLINSLNLELHRTLIEEIKNVVDDILGASFSQVIPDMYKAGKSVFEITFGSKNFMTREMRSPASFMGNLQGEDLTTARDETGKLYRGAAKESSAVKDEAELTMLVMKDKNGFKKGIGILTSNKDHTNYDVNTKEFSKSFNTYYSTKKDEIQASAGDSVLNITAYGGTCDVKKEILNYKSYDISDEFVKNINESFENYVKLAKIDIDREKAEKEKEITDIKLSSTTLFTKGELLEGLNSEKATTKNNALRSMGYGKYLISAEIPKTTADDVVKGGFVAKLGKMGISLPTIGEYLKNHKDITTQKQLILDKNILEMKKMEALSDSSGVSTEEV